MRAPTLSCSVGLASVTDLHLFFTLTRVDDLEGYPVPFTPSPPGWLRGGLLSLGLNLLYFGFV